MYTLTHKSGMKIVSQWDEAGHQRQFHETVILLFCHKSLLRFLCLIALQVAVERIRKDIVNTRLSSGCDLRKLPFFFL